MLTYSFDNRGKYTLYEYLYKQIKNDINTNKLLPKEKLPSKRALAKHLNISTITVENAYSQLVAEGYLYTIPKSGYYVSEIPVDNYKLDKDYRDNITLTNREKPTTNNYFVDFVNNSTAPENFPFTTWNKMMRETMSEDQNDLMIKSPSIGVYRLRCAIVKYLYSFRGIDVEPEQILVGAGTEYLYGLIIQLLGRDRRYAVEEPGYQKISHIYHAYKMEYVHINLDPKGINISELEQSGADILHITPSHHFPTGLVTPISRRYELLSWASKSKDRYIIEDDYDSEFRLLGKPIPALQSIDVSGKVIYINTFSKSLTSTIRISYMVLPMVLMEAYRKELDFYSCTVSNFEQYTLARFIEQGYLEKHINRMRNHYRNIRDRILYYIKKYLAYKKGRIMEEDAGLHFLLELDTVLSDEELITVAAQNGINISCLSQYYYDQTKAISNTIILNYSGVNADNIKEGIDRLFKTLS